MPAPDKSNPDTGSPTPPPGRVYEVLTAGDQIGEFTVEGCLSYDILGSLYHVTSQNGESKTLYVLPKLLSEDDAFLRRFKEFKEKQVELAHPRILTLGESHTIEGRFCFIAEPVDGKSLPDYLGAAGIYPTFRNPQGVIRAHPSEAAKDFTPDKVLKVAREVLEALDFAHAHGVMHLNLTPSNMLLLENGDIKVVGFGVYGSIGTHSIEMLVSAGIPPVSLGPRNVRLNTADIISPEVHLKQEPDARADFYAFGMSIYWLLTGLKPAANYRPPSGIVPGLNPGWDLFLARCLTRERNRRYSNARAALKDLENLSTLSVNGYADDVAKSNAAGRGFQGFSRKKVVFAAIGGAVAAMIAGVSCYYLFLDTAMEEDHTPPNSKVTRTVGEDARPDVTLRIMPPRARVTVTPGLAEFGTTGGELLLNAKPGKYTFLVTSTDYMSQRIAVNVVAGKPVVRAISLFKQAGYVDLTTAPGATVTLIDDKGSTLLLGTTDAQGKLSAQAGPGTYTLLVEKADCTPTRSPGTIVKVGEHTPAKVVLEGAPATLTLTSNPPGAGIRIDDSDSGTTPLTLENIKPGREITVVFTRENYRPVTRKVVLDAGDRKTLDPGEMIPARGTIAIDLKLSGRKPDAAKLAGVTVARSDDNLRELSWEASQKLPDNVPVGHYLLKISHPDYEPYQSAFSVGDDETTRIPVNLKALPARMEITGLPEGLRYTLRINNREYNEPPREIPADVPLHIEVELRDYQTFSGDYMATPRKEFILPVKLRRLAPPPFGKPYDLPYMGTKFVWVPPGETRLGSTADEPGHSVAEEPVTRARFSLGFWMGRTEVTQAEYRRVLDSNPSRFPGDTRPVDSVSHNDALRYCKVLTAQEAEAGRLPAGYEFRLPNEIEWEYACRAGTTTPFSFPAPVTPAKGNFLGDYPNDGRVPSWADFSTKPVGSYRANAYGLVDMHGNVREWTIEAYKGHLPGGRRVDYTPASSDLAGDTFVVRGGSWKTAATEARSAYRPAEGLPPATISDDLGFRIVLAPVSR